MEIINAKDLKKIYKRSIKKNFFKDIFREKNIEVIAVDNISFQIKKGESVAFLGPNGAGKTTTIKMLTGLMYPSSGKIDILGYIPFERNKQFSKSIGLVLGNKSSLNWDLTPFESFKLQKSIYNIKDDDFAKSIEEFTSLLEVKHLIDTQVRKLSLGERMKMELISSILHNPQILFLDEPTIGLDITSKKRIRKFLRIIQRDRNITILLTSHDMDDIEEVSDRVIVINKGKKIYDDSLVKLVITYAKDKVIRFYFNQNINIIKKLLSDYDSRLYENFFEIKVEKSIVPEIIKNFLNKIEITDIDIISTPLEDIIEDIYQNE